MASSLILSATQEPNAAPVEPLKRYVDASGEPYQPFDQWLKRLCVQLEQTHDATWDELHIVWEKIDKFIEGKQLLRRSHRGSGWRVIPAPETTNSPIRTQNKLGFYSRSLVAKWVSSRTKVRAVAGDDSDEATGAARAAQTFIDAIWPRLFTEEFRQQEGLAAQAHGTYARYFFYDPEADGGYADRPVTQQQEVKNGEDGAECLDCGYAGSAAEFSGGQVDPNQAVNPDAAAMGQANASSSICPHCGSTAVELQPAPVAVVENVVSIRKEKLGNIRALSVPYSQLRHEISCKLEKSPWVRWRRRVRREELKAKFPKLKVPNAPTGPRDTGLEYEDQMQRNIAGDSLLSRRNASIDKDQYADFTQWWFDPCMYAEYVFPVDTYTVQGQMIPAGAKAKDLFPKGMYIASIDGIDAPLEVHNEHHKDHWVTAPYHLRLFTGIGLGINDAVEMQQQWNVLLSLVFEQIRKAALPGMLYDKDAIEPDKVRLLGLPQNNVPVSLRNRAEGTRVEQLVMQLPPGQIPSHIPWYVGQVDSNMQVVMGELNFTAGLPGVDNKTATGAQIAASMAQSHNAPEFALKAEADVESAYRLLNLGKTFFIDPRFFPLKGKNGRQDGIWLSKADLGNGEVKFEADPSSALPNTRFEKLEAMERLLNAFGGPAGLMQAKQMAPAFVAQLANTFGAELEDDSYNANALLCRRRVDQVEEMATQFGPMLQQAAQAGMMQQQVGPMGQPIDPMAMVADQIAQAVTPKISPEEPGHMVSILWLQELLIDDEMVEADEFTRECVKALIRAHMQANVAQQQAIGAAQIMAQLPQMQAGMAMQADREQQIEQREARAGERKTDQQMRTDAARANFKPGSRSSPKPQANK